MKSLTTKPTRKLQNASLRTIRLLRCKKTHQNEVEI